MLSSTRIAFIAATVAILAAGIHASFAGEAEDKATCAEADARYKELYGNQTLPEGTVVVTTYNYRFCPPSITVKKGTTVRWVNVDKRTSHSVWLKEAGKEESTRFFPEESWEVKFDEPGKYPYLCGPHWDQEKMVGTVTVE